LHSIQGLPESAGGAIRSSERVIGRGGIVGDTSLQ
jgi:hypothetical protein